VVAGFRKITARKDDRAVFGKELQRCAVDDQTKRDAVINRSNLSYTSEAVHLLFDRAVVDLMTLDDDAESVRSIWLEFDSNVETIVTRFRDQRAIVSDFDVLERFGRFVKVFDFAYRVSLKPDAIGCRSQPQLYRERHLLVERHCRIMTSSHPRNLYASSIFVGDVAPGLSGVAVLAELGAQDVALGFEALTVERADQISAVCAPVDPLDRKSVV
jgi:hypothetical protein